MNVHPEIVTYVGRLPGDIAVIIDPSGSKPGKKYVLVVPTDTVWSIKGSEMNTGGLLLTITLKLDVVYTAPSNKVTVMGYDPVTAVINGEMFNV